jgi:membrane protein
VTEGAEADEKPKESKLESIRRKRPGIDHLFRANEAYTERYGNHYAAAITYFSVLSLFPLALVAFAVLGFVLAGQPDLLAQLQENITTAAPANLRDLLKDLVNTAIDQRSKVGIIGLVSALYTGLGWMSNLRDALTAQWGQEKVKQPFLRGLGVDLLSLLGLGLAMAVSFGLTAVGSGLADTLLRLVGLDGFGWAKVLLVVIATALSIAASWLIFLWVLSRLPRAPVSVRSAVRGALAAAVGFEILKAVATFYLAGVSGGPLGALFGPIIGLLVFANLVSRFLLYVTAWAATATENMVPAEVEPPPPAVIRPVVEVRRTPSARGAAGLVGVGALLGLGWRRRRR